jgi:hypothetical protein
MRHRSFAEQHPIQLCLGILFSIAFVITYWPVFVATASSSQHGPPSGAPVDASGCTPRSPPAPTTSTWRSCEATTGAAHSGSINLRRGGGPNACFGLARSAKVHATARAADSRMLSRARTGPRSVSTKILDCKTRAVPSVSHRTLPGVARLLETRHDRAADAGAATSPPGEGVAPYLLGGRVVQETLVLGTLEAGDVVLAHDVGVAAMHSPRGVRVGVMRLRIGEPAAAVAWRRGHGIFCLARLAAAASRRAGVWVVGECNADGRQRDERGDQDWQDDGAFHGIPPIVHGARFYESGGFWACLFGGLASVAATVVAAAHPRPAGAIWRRRRRDVVRIVGDAALTVDYYLTGLAICGVRLGDGGGCADHCGNRKPCASRRQE